MAEYIIKDIIRGRYYTNRLLPYKNPLPEWSFDISDAYRFDDFNNVRNVIIKYRITDIVIVKNPQDEDEEEIAFDIDDCISQKESIEYIIKEALENQIKKYLEAGIEKENLTDELIKYYTEKGFSIGVPIEYFGEIIINPKEKRDVKIVYNPDDYNRDTHFYYKDYSSLINDEEKFISIIKEIEKKVNSELWQFGISNEFEYIRYFEKLVFVGITGRRSQLQYKYKIYLKFKIAAHDT